MDTQWFGIQPPEERTDSAGLSPRRDLGKCLWKVLRFIRWGLNTYCSAIAHMDCLPAFSILYSLVQDIFLYKLTTVCLSQGLGIPEVRQKD